ncbi:sensor histidine kinase [Algoriphagus resistens]|uniref:sensor histidine kinase n=1 Tax=Algoriphagus resistens TaxID=1750590 RepID=UPI000716BA30|nr:histidine kinase [Algoriphagus resistens]
MSFLSNYDLLKQLSVILVLVLLSCCEKKARDKKQLRAEALEVLKELENESQKLSGDEQTVFWQRRLSQKPYSGDSVLSARIHYRLAGSYYYKGDLDSIKWHMRKAWDLMESQDGPTEMMALLNYGQGNIATIEGNLHQENYYFNHASQIIFSDTLIGLTPVQIASLYLATAQSDANLGQYKQAMEWNRRAIKTLEYDRAPVALQYRAFRQLANNYRVSSDDSIDSAYHYMQKMEALSRRYPDQVNPRFLYDEKAHYFTKIEQLDSAVVYHLKILEIDKQTVESANPHPSFFSNLFKDYVYLSDSYLKLNRQGLAHQYMQEATRFLQEEEKYLTDADYVLYQEALVDYFFLTHQYKKAYQEYSRLLDKNQILYENEYAQSIAEMSTIYQLQANERRILSLNRQVLLSESKLAQNRLLLVISGLSALLAVAIVAILYIGKKQLRLKEEKEKVQLQKSAIELEQRLLRTQMEPHFIFNTLSALQSYIRIEEKEKALRYLNKFSRLLRNSLELSRESQVPLENEIETLAYYLELQRMRYDETFDFEIHQPSGEDIVNVLIPPMLIQPFVENAIVHGVANAAGRGMISVALKLQEESLFVSIVDNGPGIKAVKQKPDGKKKSLSTTISRERLEILAREKGVMVQVTILDRHEMDSTLTGTIVELIIPVESDF